MRNILAIDIGNTNVTCGLFRGEALVKKARFPSHETALRRRLALFCGLCGPCEVIISSVEPEVLARVLKAIKGTRPLKRGLTPMRITVLGKDMLVPIKNLYRKKDEVGQDRLVNAFAARRFYGAPAVIIDFGTAVTFDIVSRKGEYLGGLIFPGIKMSLEGLHEKTALLPKVELKPALSIIGKNTADSMRGGILFGLGAMCDSLIARYRKVLGPGMKVIATGGNAKLISRYTKSIRIVDEDLTLKGLQAAYISITNLPPCLDIPGII